MMDLTSFEERFKRTKAECKHRLFVQMDAAVESIFDFFRDEFRRSVRDAIDHQSRTSLSHNQTAKQTPYSAITFEPSPTSYESICHDSNSILQSGELSGNHENEPNLPTHSNFLSSTVDTKSGIIEDVLLAETTTTKEYSFDNNRSHDNDDTNNEDDDQDREPSSVAQNRSTRKSYCPYRKRKYPTVPSTSTNVAVVKNKRVKKFRCEFDGCGKAFNNVGHLRDHEFVHLDMRPFRCKWPDCMYDSTRRSNVVAHVRRVHFRLPVIQKDQRRLNIQDDRDPAAYIEVLLDLDRSGVKRNRENVKSLPKAPS